MPVRILEHVDERALELRGVGAHQRQVAVDRQREVIGLRRELIDRCGQHLLDRHPLSPGRRDAGLETGLVKQVLDQARQAPRLLGDHRGQLLALRL